MISTKTTGSPLGQAYLVGSGIASLAAAVYLIRDGQMPGSRIQILEEMETDGGCLDASGRPEGGYLMRGGRMFEEHFVCTYDLLSQIPTLENPSKSARDDIFDFYSEASWYARTRLVNREGQVVDVSNLGFGFKERQELAQLLMSSEESLGTQEIQNYFSKEFFRSNFWLMWCSMFAFEPWHSLVEMRRYLLRFIHLFPSIATMSGIYHTRYNQYDSMIRPIVAWLKARGVKFARGVKVVDIDFHSANNTYRATALVCESGDGGTRRIALEEKDFVIVTNGSMVAASTIGSMEQAPALNRGDRGGAWTLWEKLSEKRSEFGNPRPFTADIDKTKWESFTVTTRTPALKKTIESWTQNELGRGGLITFIDSPWMMSVNFHRNPVYPDQPQDAYVWWGYGLFPDRVGTFVTKKMSECTGRELLVEACGHFKFSTELTAEILSHSVSIPCMLPYITSQFMPRSKGDRPEVVPQGSENLAFVGQYSEVPDDTVFTVEYSVRSAKVAVTKLLNLPDHVQPVYKGHHDLRVLFRAVEQML